MKRATLEATDENILQSIKEQNGTRNTEIKDFIEALELIEGNMFISLDARWGEGKTFYVRQIEKTLEYQTMKNFSTDDTQDELDKMKLYFTGTTLEEIDLKHSYLPVYYNAWLYDNHGDPLMSLLYVIVKKCGIWIDSKLTKDKTEKLKDLIKSVQVSLGMFSIGGDKVIDSFIEKDIFKDIQLAEDIRQKVKEIFNEIIEEQTQKLVIFIDELDRCKPSFTVRLLEQIKHYMHDERITYVLSINTEELQHTIKNYYGDSFDACRYLDRFFYLRINLPPVDKKKFYMNIELNGRYYLEIISRRIIDVYNMQLREITRFYRQVRTAAYVPTHDDEKWNCIFPDGEARQFMLSCIVPIIIGLKMVDISMYEQFISGKSGKPMVDILNTKEFSTGLLCRFLKEDESFSQIEKKKLITPEEKILEIYNAIFVNKYSGNDYQKTIGKCEFDADSRKFVLVAASMLSQYANYEI